MITFFTIFAVAIVSLLAAQALDVECARPPAPRRRILAARRVRMPFRLSFRNMLGGEAR